MAEYLDAGSGGDDIGWSPAVKESWRQYLRIWQTEVHPQVFAPYGVSLEAAMLMSEMSKLHHAIEQLDAGDGDDEPWKGPRS